MITPQKILAKAKRVYPKYLSNIISPAEFFPLEIPFEKLKTTQEYAIIKEHIDLLTRYSKVKQGYGYTIKFKKYNTRKYHIQSLPRHIYFETETDYLKYLHKMQEVKRFKQIIQTLKREIPKLEPWLQANPHKVIRHLEDWDDLIKVCRYFIHNPRPSLYIRQLPVKIYTKFIETRKGIIRELLEYLLPEKDIDQNGVNFEQRFHLKYEEPLARVRLLDENLRETYGMSFEDLSLPVSEFCQLKFSSCRIIITENKMNFLTLPSIENTVAIWSGGGFHVGILKTVMWLKNLEIFYWGDLDIQGFQILAQIRAYFPQTVSIMMNKETWEDFKSFAVKGTPAPMRKFSQLTPEEEILSASLCRNNLRLEQEKIFYSYAVQKLQEALEEKMEEHKKCK